MTPMRVRVYPKFDSPMPFDADYFTEERRLERGRWELENAYEAVAIHVEFIGAPALGDIALVVVKDDGTFERVFGNRAVVLEPIDLPVVAR